MDSISDEISAREDFDYLKKADGYEESMERRNTTSSLYVAQTAKVCLFCGNKNHYSDKCDVIKEINLRKQKIK